MTAPKIEMLPVTSLKPWKKNARTHSKKQIKQIADSIDTFGFTNTILIDSEMNILAGHGRVEAAKILKIESVPCIRLDQMTPDQKRAYVIADNKLALNAGRDEELLAEELQALLDLDLEFDTQITGFSISKGENLIDGCWV